MQLYTVESQNITCPVCHTGIIGSNLKCQNEYCKEQHTVSFVKRGVPDNYILTKLNNISIYQMGELGIDSAISAETHSEFQNVFSDFENWYSDNYGRYKSNNYVFLKEDE